MNKINIFAVAAVFFAFGLTAAPASAGWKEQCAADIKFAEGELAGASANWIHYANVQSFIDIAKKALADGKKKCQKVMKKAKGSSLTSNMNKRAYFPPFGPPLGKNKTTGKRPGRPGPGDLYLSPARFLVPGNFTKLTS